MVFNLFIFICVEIPVSIKEKYFSSKVEESEVEEKEQPVLQEDTLDNLANDENDKKANVLVLEDVHGSQSQDSDDEKNKKLTNGNGIDGDALRRNDSITKDGNS